ETLRRRRVGVVPTLQGCKEGWTAERSVCDMNAGKDATVPRLAEQFAGTGILLPLVIPCRRIG
uniref:hypothetical protein n=1 Tax=Agrobacterium radiobacter TaxID=362 RepID=UPI003CE54648